MEGFYGITLELKEVEHIEPVQGFKGLTITTSRNQYIEPATGFKGLTIQLKHPGNSMKIVHYKEDETI